MLNKVLQRRKIYDHETVKYNRTELWLYTDEFPHFGTLTLQPKKRRCSMEPAWFSESVMKKSLWNCCLVENYLEVLSQSLYQLTGMLICGRLMLTTRPSLEEKWGCGRWQWGSSTEWPYFWNTYAQWDNASGRRRGYILRETVWVWTWLPFLFLSTHSWAFLLLLFYAAISLLLSVLFPYWVSPGLLLSLPGLSTGFILQSTCIWVNSCPLLDSDSFIFLGFVWLHGIWQFQG